MQTRVCSTSRLASRNGPLAKSGSRNIRPATKSVSDASCSAYSAARQCRLNWAHRFSGRWWAKPPTTYKEQYMKTVSEIVRLGPVIPVLAFESVEQGENVSRAL